MRRAPVPCVPWLGRRPRMGTCEKVVDLLFKDHAGGLDCLRCGGVLRLHRLNVCITGQERESAVDQPLQVMIGQVVIDAGPIRAPSGCANRGAKGFAEAVIFAASVASAPLG